MEKFIILGGRRLSGKVRASTSKNATLPIMAASLLSEEPTIIKNAPKLTDVETMMEMLTALGVKVKKEGKNLYIDPSGRLNPEAPYEIVKRMRASYYVLGSLLGRMRRAKVAFPGGCAIGPRPIDLHLKGMEKLDAKVKIEHGFIIAEASSLKGAEMTLEGPSGSSVGATCNVMLAATLAKGRTVIRCAACEPEVVDLASFLNKMGAKIRGAGTPVITIDGVKRLKGVEYKPIPDRIETATLLVAGVITRGEVEVTHCIPEHLRSVLEKLEEAGAEIELSKNSIRVRISERPKSLRITTAPYPGFPTDMQAQFMALLSLASNTSIITETIFEARFLHALELGRMGADITLEANRAIIKGVEKLTGAPVMASDLRASAALVLAGLAAEGRTDVSRIYHLDRGYEHLERKLNSLGASIRREEE